MTWYGAVQENAARNLGYNKDGYNRYEYNPDKNQQYYGYSVPGVMTSTGGEDLRNFQSSIPNLYNTSGLNTSYNNMMNSMMSTGRNLAAAGASAYANKAMQSGASGAGASFAQAQSMLPLYSQRAQMMTDFQKADLNNRQAQADIGFKTASSIEDQSLAYKKLLSDYITRTQANDTESAKFAAQVQASQPKRFDPGAPPSALNATDIHGWNQGLRRQEIYNNFIHNPNMTLSGNNPDRWW